MKKPEKFTEYSDLLRKIASDQYQQILNEIGDKLPNCGIVHVQVTLARAIEAKIENLPPSYEICFGDPEEHGWTLPEAFAYVRTGAIARDWGRLQPQRVTR